MKRKTKRILLIAVVLSLLVAAAGVAFYQPPLNILGSYQVLKSIGPEDKTGDLWGLDIFLAKKSAALLDAGPQRTKDIMTWLFAEKILETSAWGRPLDDIRYSFYVMRKENLRKMSAGELFLIKLKNKLFGFPSGKGGMSDPEVQTLKKLREESPLLSAADMEAKCRDLLDRSEGSDIFKAKLLVRAAYLEEQRFGKGARQDIAWLKSAERKKGLPYYLVLTMRELSNGVVLREKSLAKKVKNFAIGETGAVLSEYQNALERLTVHDPAGFVEHIKKMTVAYPKKDFSPVLLYQAWGVLKYDLNDPVAAEAALAGFRESFPVSELTRPEKGAGVWDLDESRVIRAGQPAIQPPSFLRNAFKTSFVGVARNIKRFTGMLEEGKSYEKDFDETTVNQWMGDFMPPSAKKILTGYKVSMTDDGMGIYAGVKFGVVNFSLEGKGALTVQPGPDGGNVALKFRELKLQNVSVPKVFLEQIENDFNSAWQGANTSLDVQTIQYRAGGMKVALKKKAAPFSKAAAVEKTSGTAPAVSGGGQKADA